MLLENALAAALRGGQAQSALGLLLTVQCSEEFPLNGRVVERPLSARTWDLYAAACEHWPRIPVPSEFHERFSSNAAALIVAGEWDPVTGPRWADGLAKLFPQSTVAIIAEGTHGLSDVGPCLSDVFRAFLDGGRNVAPCLSSLVSRKYFIPGRPN